MPSEQTGSAGLSPHIKWTKRRENGLYKGLTLSELWDEHRHLFGHIKGDRFPLLTKFGRRPRPIRTSASK
ncbi:hypothetical protein PO124_13040 [Bacillus licheniformis]|nr:hypothetical protein [Bacillus licheniformis]